MKVDISLMWYHSTTHMNDRYESSMTLKLCLCYLDIWVQAPETHFPKNNPQTFPSLEKVQSSPWRKIAAPQSSMIWGGGEGHHMMPVSRYSAQPLLSPSLRVFPFIFLNAAHGLTATGIRELLSLPFHNKGEYFIRD